MTSPVSSRHPGSPAPRECAICQSLIHADDRTTSCPVCGLVYHAECWAHNLGCAAYGCGQVNALAPKPPEVSVTDPPPPMVEPTKPPLPWSFLLLGASAAALVLSAVLYGLPSLLITVVAAWRLTRKRTHRDPILLAALLLGVTGAVLGMALSRLWWTSD